MNFARYLIAFFLTVVVTGSVALAITFNDPLVDAADRGELNIMRHLIKKGHFIDSEGDFKTTALMRAAFRGYDNVVKYLLDEGANVNAEDLGGATALHLAARNGHDKIVKILLSYDADINAQDKEGWSPLMRASISKQGKVVETLLQQGADISMQNDIDESAIVHATLANSADIARKILQFDTDNKITEEQKQLAISLAKEKYHSEVEQVLTGGNITPLYPKRDIIKQNNNSGAAMQDSPKAMISKPQPAIPQAPTTSPAPQATQSNIGNIVPPLPPATPADKKIEYVEIENKEKINNANSGTAPSIFNKNENFAPISSQSPAQNTQPGNNIKYVSVDNTYGAQGNQVMYMLQLGAYPDPKQAEYIWSLMKEKNADILNPYTAKIVESYLAVNRSIVYRLRVGEFDHKQKAQSLCNNLRNRDIECFVVESAKKGAAPINVPQQQVAQTAPPQVASIEPPRPAITSAPTMPAQRSLPSSIPPSRQVTSNNLTPIAPPAPTQHTPSQQQQVYAASANQLPKAPWEKSSAESSYVQGSLDKPKQWQEKQDPNNYKPLSILERPQMVPSSPPPPITNAKAPSKRMENITTNADSDLPWKVDERAIQEQQAIALQQQQQAMQQQKAMQQQNSQYHRNYPSLAGPQYDPIELQREVMQQRKREFLAKQGISSMGRKGSYEDIESTYSGMQPGSPMAKSNVAEAIHIPNEDYFAHQPSHPFMRSQQQANQLAVPPQNIPQGVVIIGNFISHQQAQDYWDRMFKYDQSMQHLQMNIQNINPTTITIAVRTQLPYEAQTICGIVQSSGYQCVYNGGNQQAGQNRVPNQYASSQQPFITHNQFWIQLGTYRNLLESENYWMFILQENQDIIGSYQYNVTKADPTNDANTSIRLRVGPFSNSNEPTRMCGMLRQRNIACIVSNE